MTAVFALHSAGFGSSAVFSRVRAAGWDGLWLLLHVAWVPVQLQSDEGADTGTDAGERVWHLESSSDVKNWC